MVASTPSTPNWQHPLDSGPALAQPWHNIISVSATTNFWDAGTIRDHLFFLPPSWLGPNWNKNQPYTWVTPNVFLIVYIEICWLLTGVQIPPGQLTISCESWDKDSPSIKAVKKWVPSVAVMPLILQVSRLLLMPAALVYVFIGHKGVIPQS